MHGAVQFERVKLIEEELWEWLANRNRYGTMGRRVSMARYGVSLHAALKHRGLWSV